MGDFCIWEATGGNIGCDEIDPHATTRSHNGGSSMPCHLNAFLLQAQPSPTRSHNVSRTRERCPLFRYYKLSRALPAPTTAKRSISLLGEHMHIVAGQLLFASRTSFRSRGKDNRALASACTINAKHIALLGHHSLPRVLFQRSNPGVFKHSNVSQFARRIRHLETHTLKRWKWSVALQWQRLQSSL
jgi:hypothetical protein